MESHGCLLSVSQEARPAFPHPDSGCPRLKHQTHQDSKYKLKYFPKLSTPFKNCFQACNSHKEIWHIYLDLTQAILWETESSKRKELKIPPHGAWLVGTSGTLQRQLLCRQHPLKSTRPSQAAHWAPGHPVHTSSNSAVKGASLGSADLKMHSTSPKCQPFHQPREDRQ